MTDLSSLIERIEKSEGASIVLDRDIALTQYPDARPLPNNDARISIWDGNGRTQLTVKPYTASIDAAMTLVPEGWIVEIRRYFNNDGEFVSAVSLTDSFTVGRGCDPEEEVTVSSRIVERRQGIDPTPLALCASALKARIQSHEG